MCHYKSRIIRLLITKGEALSARLNVVTSIPLNTPLLAMYNVTILSIALEPELGSQYKGKFLGDLHKAFTNDSLAST